MKTLQNAHILLTGASSGIGAALARALADAGARLTLVARRKARLEALAEELPGEHRVLPADLADLEAADRVAREAVDAGGPIDGLINNAGVQIVRPTARTTAEEGEWLFRIDTLAPFRLIHALLPPMLERGAGYIVNIASLAAVVPTAGMFHYSAAKAALAGGSEALASELRGTGVRVLTVYPGPVETDMAAAAVTHYQKDPTGAMPVGTPDVLARKVVDAMRRGRPRLYYPRSYGLARQFPGTTRFLVDRLTPALVDEAD